MVQNQINEFHSLVQSGIKAVEVGDTVKSLVFYERAAQVCPEAWFGVASKEIEDGDVHAAMSKLHQVVRYAKTPQTKSAALNSIGMILTRWGRRGPAMDFFLEAYSLWKESSNILNIATSYQWRQDHAAAIKWFDKAVQLNPRCHEAYFGRALSKLISGDWLGGWIDYEARWRKKTKNCLKPAFLKMPEWSGQSLKGKTLLIYLEQGAGDTIQMMRFIPEIRRRGGKVAMVSGQGLGRIIAALADRIVTDLENDPADFCISTMSLPRMFQTTPANVPRADYLNDVPPMELKGDFKVGICWAGSSDHVNDRLRSIDLQEWKPIFDVPGVTFYNLQKGSREIDAMIVPNPMHNLELGDYLDTARAVKGLDLVISVDTSVVHVAGAVGTPCLMLTPFAPDWRWGMTGNVSPWYPGVELIRQAKEGEWAETMERAALTLRNKVNGS